MARKPSDDIHSHVAADLEAVERNLCGKSLSNNVVHLFTDGSSSLRLKRGGWGYLVYSRGHIVLEAADYAKNATNNQMEFEAIFRGIVAAKTLDLPVIVYSDSQYCINCLASWHHNWRKNNWITVSGTPVKNRERIEIILEEISSHKHNIGLKWVKGHVGHPGNERADYLAGIAAHTMRGIQWQRNAEGNNGSRSGPSVSQTTGIPTGVPTAGA